VSARELYKYCCVCVQEQATGRPAPADTRQMPHAVASRRVVVVSTELLQYCMRSTFVHTQLIQLMKIFLRIVNCAEFNILTGKFGVYLHCGPMRQITVAVTTALT
jgi:hypothetical protein